MGLGSHSKFSIVTLNGFKNSAFNFSVLWRDFIRRLHGRL